MSTTIFHSLLTVFTVQACDSSPSVTRPLQTCRLFTDLIFHSNMSDHIHNAVNFISLSFTLNCPLQMSLEI